MRESIIKTVHVNFVVVVFTWRCLLHTPRTTAGPWIGLLLGFKGMRLLTSELPLCNKHRGISDTKEKDRDKEREMVLSTDVHVKVPL